MPKQRTVFTPIKKKTTLGSPAKSMVLDKVNLSSEKEVNYRLRLWVREGAVVDPSATYSVKIKVFGQAKQTSLKSFILIFNFYMI